MIQVSIIDQAGKPISPQQVSTAAELSEAVDQARRLIRECESIARLKSPPARSAGSGVIPYLN
jgi:hypothetical protein